MDVSEKWGTDVETAVELALAELKCSREEVEVTVLEQPSRGFFGIGSKLALVRVEKKAPVVEAEPAPVVVEEEAPVAAPQKQKPQKSDTKVEKKKNKKEVQPKKSSIEEEVGNLSPVEDLIALVFLKEVTEQMGLVVDVTAKANEDSVLLNIQGKDSGTIIGKRGQTLDAIQYLTSLVVNKDQDNYIKVVVDAENYRSKREKTLEKLANRLADKVVKTKRSVRLEPMNPYERKVIHATLQSNPRVTTRSEGQDPYRRVIIELK